MNDKFGRESRPRHGDQRFQNDPRYTRSREADGGFFGRGEEDQVLRSPEQEFETSGPYREPPEESYREGTATDERIREDVRDRLSRNDDVDATGIAVRVEKGKVTLEGSVASLQMKRLAEDLAEQVPGVLGVRSTLRAPLEGGPGHA